MTTATSDMGPFSLVPRWVAEACKGQHLALAIYVWIADHADRSYGGDSGYTIGREEIASAHDVGRSTAGRAIEHLVKSGALTVTPQRVGRQQGWSRFHVHQVDPQRPAHEPLTSGPVQRPASGPVIQEPLVRTPSCPTPSDEVIERFARFWSMYPRKEAKLPAERAFKSMMKRNHLTDARRALPLHIQMWVEQKRPREKIPLAASWLNQQRYFDELEVNTHFAAPVAGKHRDAGKIRYRGDNSRFMVGDDGSEIDMPEES